MFIMRECVYNERMCLLIESKEVDDSSLMK